MNEQSQGKDAAIRTQSALVDERSESDDQLRLEREMVDHTVYHLQHDKLVSPSTQRTMGDLRRRLRQQRLVVDRLRDDTRRATDQAIDQEQRSTTDDLRRAEVEKELVEEALHLSWKDAQRSLWSILAEIDVIASSVHAIRLRSVGKSSEHDVSDLATAIEVASEHLLEIVGNMLDPSDRDG